MVSVEHSCQLPSAPGLRPPAQAAQSAWEEVWKQACRGRWPVEGVYIDTMALYSYFFLQCSVVRMEAANGGKGARENCYDSLCPSPGIGGALITTAPSTPVE